MQAVEEDDFDDRLVAAGRAELDERQAQPVDLVQEEVVGALADGIVVPDRWHGRVLHGSASRPLEAHDARVRATGRPVAHVDLDQLVVERASSISTVRRWLSQRDSACVMRAFVTPRMTSEDGSKTSRRAPPPNSTASGARRDSSAGAGAARRGRGRRRRRARSSDRPSRSRTGRRGGGRLRAPSLRRPSRACWTVATTGGPCGICSALKHSPTLFCSSIGTSHSFACVAPESSGPSRTAAACRSAAGTGSR